MEKVRAESEYLLLPLPPGTTHGAGLEGTVQS